MDNSNKLKVLYVETGLLSTEEMGNRSVIDYHVYEKIPKWWRKLEMYLRMDFYLVQ